jgi:hypothetical protein
MTGSTLPADGGLSLLARAGAASNDRSKDQKVS